MKSVPLILYVIALSTTATQGLLAQTVAVSDVEANNPAVQRQTLTLGDAMAETMANSAVLQAATYQQQADIARAASTWDGTPNPELSVEAEDFLGNGVARRANALQVTTSVSQEVEFGKKSMHRKNVRDSQREVTSFMQALVQQNLRADVALAFLDVLAQQARLTHAKEMVSLSHKTVEIITAKVEAGRSTGMEQEKATVELSLARLRETEAARALDVAKIRLAAACGSDVVFFREVTGDLNIIAGLPRLNDLLLRVQKHPALLVANATVRHQRALAEDESARRIPNVTFALGFRWNNASSSRAMVAGVGVPIPLLDRNRGNIEAAAKEVQRSESEMDAKKIDLIKEITVGHQTLTYEQQRLNILQKEIVPSVEATFSAVEEGYRIGRFGYLDLLDAQRTLFDVKNMVLDALVHYQAARISLNRTAGLPVLNDMFEAAPAAQTTSHKEKP